MKRRNLLGGAAALAAARAFAADPKDPHAGHEHHAAGIPNAALVSAAHECMATGDACLRHCIDSLAAGDASLADCAKSVEQMRAMVGALATVAAQNGPRLKELSAVCAKACRDCEAQCRKHDKHPPCKACGDACTKCAAECDKTAA
ncbi:MAG TPA: four-helix bundle copper-binding protein [Myxococcales bacterium]|jgi:Cys-rich four helix bundle protein (predicted Tat secretion target)|nr:four-helix bundle copper-binding protein [Myxococcales bacterium]